MNCCEFYFSIKKCFCCFTSLGAHEGGDASGFFAAVCSVPGTETGGLDILLYLEYNPIQNTIQDPWERLTLALSPLIMPHDALPTPPQLCSHFPFHLSHPKDILPGAHFLLPGWLLLFLSAWPNPRQIPTAPFQDSSFSLQKNEEGEGMWGKLGTWHLCVFMVAHSCNPSYLGEWDGKDHGLRPDRVVFKTPISKNNQSKMNWRCGSSVRAPALQVQTPVPPWKKNNQQNLT
jgi:hypothetical protein